jgi:hypothetical protein
VTPPTQVETANAYLLFYRQASRDFGVLSHGL